MDLINIVAISSCIISKTTDTLLTVSIPLRLIATVLFENTTPPPNTLILNVEIEILPSFPIRFLQKKLEEYVKISWELILSDHIGSILSTFSRNHWSWREKFNLEYYWGLKV